MTNFRYEHDKVENKAKSRELGRPYFEDRVVCRFMKPGGDIVLPVTDAFKASHFTPRSNAAVDVENARTLQRVYEEFLALGENRDPGFPVREWSQVTRAEAENLIGLGLSTLEKVAAADDSLLRDMTGGRQLKEKAQAWLADAAEKGVVANKAVQLQAELDAAKREIAELTRNLAAAGVTIDGLTAQIAAAPAAKPKGK